MRFGGVAHNSPVIIQHDVEAIGSAESYLDYSSFSRQGLIDQLLYEGFSPEQAESGVVAVGY